MRAAAGITLSRTVVRLNWCLGLLTGESVLARLASTSSSAITASSGWMGAATVCGLCSRRRASRWRSKLLRISSSPMVGKGAGAAAAGLAGTATAKVSRSAKVRSRMRDTAGSAKVITSAGSTAVFLAAAASTGGQFSSTVSSGGVLASDSGVRVATLRVASAKVITSNGVAGVVLALASFGSVASGTCSNIGMAASLAAMLATISAAFSTASFSCTGVSVLKAWAKIGSSASTSSLAKRALSASVSAAAALKRGLTCCICASTRPNTAWLAWLARVCRRTLVRLGLIWRNTLIEGGVAEASTALLAAVSARGAWRLK